MTNIQNLTQVKTDKEDSVDKDKDEPLNKINEKTLHQIAMSLSPEPDQLLNQHLGVKLNIADLEQKLKEVSSSQQRESTEKKNRKNKTDDDVLVDSQRSKRSDSQVDKKGAENAVVNYDVDEMIQGLLQ